jgi:uncharacterized BrkB/YihY/UPF0761 family membrane protein
VFAQATLYRYGPAASKPKWRWITWGSVFAAIIWIITSVLFFWYTANLAIYDKTCGSLGALIAFMVWLWISIIVVLVGAAINAEIERQSALNTTRKAKAVGSSRRKRTGRKQRYSKGATSSPQKRHLSRLRRNSIEQKNNEQAPHDRRWSVGP